MNVINRAVETDERQLPAQLKLSALWAALMFLYLYADFFSLRKPGELQEALAGRIGPLPVTQGSLLAAAILMLIPAGMVFLSLALKPRVSRLVNIALGALYTAVNVWNLVGETWAFYLLFGVAELALTALIVAYAWKWRAAEGRP